MSGPYGDLTTKSKTELQKELRGTREKKECDFKVLNKGICVPGLVPEFDAYYRTIVFHMRGFHRSPGTIKTGTLAGHPIWVGFECMLPKFVLDAFPSVKTDYTYYAKFNFHNGNITFYLRKPLTKEEQRQVLSLLQNHGKDWYYNSKTKDSGKRRREEYAALTIVGHDGDSDTPEEKQEYTSFSMIQECVQAQDETCVLTEEEATCLLACHVYTTQFGTISEEQQPAEDGGVQGELQGENVQGSGVQIENPNDEQAIPVGTGDPVGSAVVLTLEKVGTENTGPGFRTVPVETESDDEDDDLHSVQSEDQTVDALSTVREETSADVQGAVIDEVHRGVTAGINEFLNDPPLLDCINNRNCEGASSKSTTNQSTPVNYNSNSGTNKRSASRLGRAFVQSLKKSNVEKGTSSGQSMSVFGTEKSSFLRRNGKGNTLLPESIFSSRNVSLFVPPPPSTTSASSFKFSTVGRARTNSDSIVNNLSEQASHTNGIGHPSRGSSNSTPIYHPDRIDVLFRDLEEKCSTLHEIQKAQEGTVHELNRGYTALTETVTNLVENGMQQSVHVNHAELQVLKRNLEEHNLKFVGFEKELREYKATVDSCTEKIERVAKEASVRHTPAITMGTFADTLVEEKCEHYLGTTVRDYFEHYNEQVMREFADRDRTLAEVQNRVSNVQDRLLSGGVGGISRVTSPRISQRKYESDMKAALERIRLLEERNSCIGNCWQFDEVRQRVNVLENDVHQTIRVVNKIEKNIKVPKKTRANSAENSRVFVNQSVHFEGGTDNGENTDEYSPIKTDHSPVRFSPEKPAKKNTGTPAVSKTQGTLVEENPDVPDGLAGQVANLQRLVLRMQDGKSAELQQYEALAGEYEVTTQNMFAHIVKLMYDVHNQKITVSELRELRAISDLKYRNPQPRAVIGDMAVHMETVTIPTESLDKYHKRLPSLPYNSYEIPNTVHQILSIAQQIINDLHFTVKAEDRVLEIIFDWYIKMYETALNLITQEKACRSTATEPLKFGIMVLKLQTIREDRVVKVYSSADCFRRWMEQLQPRITNPVLADCAEIEDGSSLSTKKAINDFVKHVFSNPVETERVYDSLVEHFAEIVRLRVQIDGVQAESEKALRNEILLIQQRVLLRCPTWYTRYNAIKTAITPVLKKVTAARHGVVLKKLHYTMFINSLKDVQHEALELQKPNCTYNLGSRELYLVQGVGRKDNYDQTGKKVTKTKDLKGKKSTKDSKDDDGTLNTLDPNNLPPMKIRFVKSTYRKGNKGADGIEWGLTHLCRTDRGPEGQMQNQVYLKKGKALLPVGEPDRNVKPDCILGKFGLCPGGLKYCWNSHLFTEEYCKEVRPELLKSVTIPFLKQKAQEYHEVLASNNGTSGRESAYSKAGYKNAEEAYTAEPQYAEKNLDISVVTPSNIRYYKDLKIGFPHGRTELQTKGDIAIIPGLAKTSLFRFAPA